MKQNKDKRIGKLKKDRIIFYFFVLVSIVLGVLIITSDIRIDDSKQELQTCQDKVPVWILKAECKYPLIDFYHYSEKNYTNYEEYLEGKQRVISFENCEVIE